MRSLPFSKMHGAGNDFIIADDFDTVWDRTPQFIQTICHRKRGIGADGLILLSVSDIKQTSPPFHPIFKMDFYNCNGEPADMCGNGLRCAALYSGKYLTDNSKLLFFETGAGVLETQILKNEKVQIQIPLIQPPEKAVINNSTYFKVNTGVPHLVIPIENKKLKNVDVETEGKYFRNLELFQPEGTNVNFVSIPETAESPVKIRTYERGVEDETSACGTGIAASAISLAKYFDFSPPVNFITQDNDVISIDFCYNENIVDSFQDLVLIGPVKVVFSGDYQY